MVAEASQKRSLTHFQPSEHWVWGSSIFPVCCWEIELEEGAEPDPTNGSDGSGEFPQQTLFSPHLMN